MAQSNLGAAVVRRERGEEDDAPEPPSVLPVVGDEVGDASPLGRRAERRVEEAEAVHNDGGEKVCLV